MSDNDEFKEISSEEMMDRINSGEVTSSEELAKLMTGGGNEEESPTTPVAQEPPASDEGIEAPPAVAPEQTPTPDPQPETTADTPPGQTPEEQQATHLAELQEKKKAFFPVAPQVAPQQPPAPQPPVAPQQQQQPPVAPLQPQQFQPTALPSMPDMPVPPVLPANPADRTMDHDKLEEDYNNEMRGYHGKMVTYNQAVGTQQQQIAQVIYDNQQREASNQQTVAKQAQEETYWAGIGSFQTTMGEFKTKTPIKELSQKAIGFEENIARAVGLVDIGDGLFDQKLDLYVDLLQAGDPGMTNIAKVNGIQTPEEYGKYRELLDLDMMRYQLIQSKQLGPEATLETVYAISRMQSGDIQEAISQSAVDAATQTAKDAGRAIRDAQQAPQPVSTRPQDITSDMSHTDDPAFIKAGLTPRQVDMAMAIDNDMSLLDDPAHKEVFLKVKNAMVLNNS